MDTWSLPKARPISCSDCPAFQRLHMSFRCCSESFTRRLNVINTTFREKIYSRWCCIDRLSWQDLSGLGRPALLYFANDQRISQAIRSSPERKSPSKMTL